MAYALKNRREIDERVALRDDLQKSIAHIERQLSGLAPVTGGRAPDSVEDDAKDGEMSAAIRQQTLRGPLGIKEIDHALDPIGGKGISLNALHEVRVETGLGAASGAGFALALGMTMYRGGLSAQGKTLDDVARHPPVFWISDHFTRNEYGRFYGPGLAVFGLRPESLIRIQPKSKEDILWAAGEITATPNAAAFCLVEITRHPKEIDLTATRRLMLRAQASATPVILLRQSGHEEASAAATRWCVAPARSQSHEKSEGGQTCGNRPLRDRFIGPPTFTVTLEKCRGGHANSSTHWTIEWNRDEQRLASTTPATSGPATRNRKNPDKGKPAASAGGAPLPFPSSAQARHRPDHAAKTG